jgi:putative ABC transport system permease protein
LETKTMPSKTPLAWLNLTHQKGRFALSLAGVGFAVVLMFVEAGFYNALLDATVALIDQFDADLVVVSKVKTSLQSWGGVPRRRLAQALGVDGVAEVKPLYLEAARSVWRSGKSGKRRVVRVLAVDPNNSALDVPEAQTDAGGLRLPDTALFDRAASSVYGRPDETTTDSELARQRVRLGGTFRLGTDFMYEGNAIVGEPAFARFFPQREGSALRAVEVGMVKLAPGADPVAVKERLEKVLASGIGTSQNAGGDDVMILTKDQFRDQERKYWQTSTPVGFVFGLGLIMGGIVGVVICYQVLATDVADHLPEFATLKAMGYSDRYLASVVLKQAVLLAVVGFIPGFMLSAALYYALGELTGLPLLMTLPRAGLVLALTVLMCSASGVLTVRKLQSADPADLF